jgi:anti-sigma factor RsiW
MSHLDEGTIHAWLDGALDATQSAEADAHVKGCAECSAKVAEARGLIAASSRILTALDDTPANVIPKPANAPARRRSIAPWISGLAAAAILVTLWRTGGVEQPKSFPEFKVPDIPAVKLPEPSLSDAVITSAPAASAPAADQLVSAEREAKLPPPSAPQPAAPALRQMEVPQVSGGRVAGAGAGAGEPAIRLRSARAPGGTEAANTAIASAPSRDTTGARSEAPDEARRALRPLPASPVARADIAREDFSVRLAGCYRMASEKSPTEVVTTAVGAASSAAKKSARAPAAASAPSAQMAAPVAPVAMMRLDTAATADGFVLRDANTGSMVGVWSPMNADSARVMIPGAGTHTFVIYDKVKCPER